MLEKANAYNYQIQFLSPELEDSKGIYFAVSNDQMGIDAALNIQGQSVQQGIFSVKKDINPTIQIFKSCLNYYESTYH